MKKDKLTAKAAETDAPLGRYKQSEFVKEIEEGKDLFRLTCSCGNTHFRHAGYMEVLIPFVSAKEGPKVADTSCSVKICLKCRKAYIIYDGKVFDVTKDIDLQAWEKFEKKAHEATGPGGQC